MSNMKVSSLVRFPSMVKPRVCQICNRTFASGKAMGGHMRSHLAKLPLPPKVPESNSTGGRRLTSAVNRGSSSSAANSNEGYDNNPNLCEVVLARSVHPSVPNETGITTSERNPPTGKRSAGRQPRRATAVTVSTTTMAESSTTSNSVSYLSQTSSDEEIAQCLLKLLHEKRPPAEGVVNEKYEETAEESDDNDDEDDDEDFEEEEEEEEDASSTIIKRKRKFSSSRGKYKCETCNRMFRSYQALGGHRASHKNKRPEKNINNIFEADDDDDDEKSGKRMVVVERRSFPCPFCEKVFDSGQALGGHKKVHLSYLGISKTAAVPSIPVKNNVKSSTLLLDLNMPAPAEGGGEE